MLNTYLEVAVAVKHLDGRCLGGVKNIPMVNGRVCDQTKRGLACPLPEGNILAHGGRLELLLLLQIEDLKCPRLGLQGNNLAGPVHNCAVGLDGPSDDVIAILEIDDKHFGGRRLVLLVSQANVGV